MRLGSGFAVALMAIVLFVATALAQSQEPSTAPTSAQGTPGASTQPSQSPAVDRLLLESLCVRNATDPADLATCLDVVHRFLAPIKSPGESSAPVANDKVTVSGGGDKSTKPFELAGGDYMATVVSRDVDSSGFGFGCDTRGSLRLTDDRSEVGSVSGTAPAKRTATTITQMYGIEPGRYYWDFGSTSCEKWTVTLESVAFTYGSEPEPGVIVRSGTGTLDTTPFALTGGDYTVDISLKASGGDCSNFDAYLIPVNEHSLFANIGDVSVKASKGHTTKDQTQLYAVEPDHYYWSVSILAFDATCDWSLTIESP